MDSDSESQDSDEGRRFRFETTRKDAVSVSQSRRKVLLQSPDRNKRGERRSRSRNRNSRDDRSRYSNIKDDIPRKSRLSNDRDTNNKYLTKDRNSKDIKNNSRDSNSRRQYNKDSRSYRSKDSRSYDSRDLRDSKDHSNNKYKSKTHEKHKKRSRDKSREKSGQIVVPEDIFKKEDKKTNSDTAFISMEIDEVKIERKRVTKKQHLENNKKVNHNSVNKVIESNSSNSIAISDIVVSLTSTMVNTTSSPKKLKSFFDRVVNKRTKEADIYGPALSLELEKKMLNANNTESHIQKNTEKIKLPVDIIPNDNQMIIGPVLPKNLRKLLLSPIEQKDNISIEKETETEIEKIKNKEIKKHSNEMKEEETFGPALPPHMERSVLLQNLISNDNKDTETHSQSKIVEDDDIVGPLPVDHPAVRESYIHIRLEQRARQIKAKFKDKVRNMSLIIINNLAFLIK
jgi:hypothetical protein